MFPGGQQIRVENGDSEEEFIEDQNDVDLGLPVDPINRHFAVSLYFKLPYSNQFILYYDKKYIHFTCLLYLYLCSHFLFN